MGAKGKRRQEIEQQKAKEKRQLGKAIVAGKATSKYAAKRQRQLGGGA